MVVWLAKPSIFLGSVNEYRWWLGMQRLVAYGSFIYSWIKMFHIWVASETVIPWYYAISTGLANKMRRHKTLPYGPYGTATIIPDACNCPSHLIQPQSMPSEHHQYRLVLPLVTEVHPRLTMHKRLTPGTSMLSLTDCRNPLWGN